MGGGSPISWEAVVLSHGRRKSYLMGGGSPISWEAVVLSHGRR